MADLIHDDDLQVYFEATQEARHAAVLRVNEMAKALVERSRANAVGQQPDEDGVIPGPQRLRMVLGFDRDDKSVKQRKFLHGVVLMQIAERVQMPDGSRYVMKVWKEFFRKRFLPDTWEMVRFPGQKRATPRRVRISTEDLSVKQYSAYIDKVIDHAVVEFGVTFDIDAQEREAVRYVAPARKRAEKREAATA